MLPGREFTRLLGEGLRGLYYYLLSLRGEEKRRNLHCWELCLIGAQISSLPPTGRDGSPGAVPRAGGAQQGDTGSWGPQGPAHLRATSGSSLWMCQVLLKHCQREWQLHGEGILDGLGDLGRLRGSWSPAWQHGQGICASLGTGMRVGAPSDIPAPPEGGDKLSPGGSWAWRCLWTPGTEESPCPARWGQCHTTRQRSCGTTLGALGAGAVISGDPAVSSPLFEPPSLSAGPAVPPEQPCTCTS